MNLLENTKIQHFEVKNLLGVGGMGEVYLAKDTRLGRDVAIKFLGEKYSKNASRLSRFVQEAKSASALNHPNIITIYEIGVFEDMHFIATEFIDGDTLHRKLKGKPLEIADALDIVIQVASALEAAHKAGIIHRDVKPENIMIRPDGLVKILDFGIAKLAEKSSELQAFNLVQTQPGIIMGTPQYMSPEQTRGLGIDSRTDIWSLGIVLFQMLTGFVPFQGDTMSDIIVAILERDVPPLEHFMSDFPSDLNRIIALALSKKVADRFQTISEFIGELKVLKRRLDFEIEFGKSSALDTAETIEMEVSEYLAPEDSISNGINKDKLLLTEFTNLTGDPIFDGTLKTALAVSLEQSPFVDIFPDSEVRETLRLMERSANEVVTPEHGREICLRKGLKAYVTGTISSFGSVYVLTLEAINARTGESIGRRLEQADSKEKVLKFLANAATGLREKLGENLSLIEQFDAQFEYTTSSLDALKIYSLGVDQQRKGNWLTAISFYKQAIALDPDFSSAYVGASSSYSNTNQPKLAAEFAARAFEMKDKVSEIERLRISHFFYAFVTGEIDKRIETLEIMHRIYPRVKTSLNNLSDCYMQLGQFEKAISNLRESIKENPRSAVSYDNLAMSLLHINNFDEAKKHCETAISLGLENIYFHNCLYLIAFVEGDEDAMDAQLEWMTGKPEEYMSFDLQAKTAAFKGQFKKSEEFSRRAIELANLNSIGGVAGTYLADQALRIVFCNFEESDEFRASLGDAVTTALELERNPHIIYRAALASVLGGLVEEGRMYSEALAAEYPKNTLVIQLWIPVVRAAQFIAEDNAPKALEALRFAARYEAAADFMPQYLRGLAFLKLDKLGDAEKEFQKILANRGQAPMSVIYPLAQLGLARASKSKDEFEKFFDLWKNADANLPILLSAKAEFAKL